MTADAVVNATFKITNSGQKAGYEIAQLYAKPINPTATRPVKELQGFTKVWLKAGETKTVSIPLDARSLSYYQQSTDSWIVDAGKYQILVGGSSDSLPLKQTISTLYAEKLPTNTSNPLPLPLQKAVQVKASRAY
ncbi:fibronectin type III-like domain-contianing protein [Rahnella sp. ChDrAdgB13]|uniref:fibronectin type III-like domain-contianing protein n=1 Tax=Rahnella sp. ChDrAdgB13 TaxID=1850581 RepID=UPI00244DD734|nr:fibronectin type III-like domain-contianing protein [Rahnella sp. ChDrAdgB13]